jgi:pimeloyl-ACP methyl ester carboxylesterase
MGDVRGEYRFLAAQLIDAGYRVVTMDIRGHGESSTGWKDYSVAALGGDLLALARLLNAGQVMIVANSYGAAAAVWAAVEAPEWVRGMVLLDPAVRGEISWQFRLLIKAVFARPWGPSAWKAYFTKLFPTRKPADFEPYIRTLTHNLTQSGRMEALQKMMLEPRTGSVDRLALVAVPTLVVMGSKDPHFKDPRAEAEWVARELHGTFQEIEGAGHYPHSELPEITGPLVTGFLNAIREKEADAAPARG